MSQEHVHLIGIGGTGMTALAGLLHQAGCRVTGSDRALYPPTSEVLRGLKLEVHEGFDPAHLDPVPDLVVVGNAISRGNPELEHVLDRDLRYDSMPGVLESRFLTRRHPIVVMGTHGKTTTTSMVAWLLRHAGRDPGFLIGGWPADLGQPSHLGTGPAFVVEGDEYDTSFRDKGPKFMHYRPRTAILGTVEFDHADIYRDLEQVKQVFRRVAHLVPASGLLIRSEDSPVTRDVTATCFSRRCSFGLQSGDWRAEAIDERPDGVRFRLLQDESDRGQARLQVGGRHNVQNALAAIAAVHEQDVPLPDILEGLAAFRGVRRRMELVAAVDGVTLIDDFAHHPTSIAFTLESLRRRYPGARLWAVLEPRSWSLRRKVFQQTLPRSLSGADAVVLAPVFQPERLDADERLDVPAVVDALKQGGTAARCLKDAASIADHLADHCAEGDVVAIMSNGGFDGLIPRLRERLEARASTNADRGVLR